MRVPAARRLKVTSDPHLDDLLRRLTKPGSEAAYIRMAIVEKAARDEYRGELDDLRRRVERLERRIDAGL